MTLKEVLEHLKSTASKQEKTKYEALLQDMLAGVTSAEEIRNELDREGAEYEPGFAERLFQMAEKHRIADSGNLDENELLAVNGGEAGALGDGWVDKGIYRYNGVLYHRSGNYRIMALDGCAQTSSASSWCWGEADACAYSQFTYDDKGNAYGDDRENIDPDRMARAFITGEITGGE